MVTKVEKVVWRTRDDKEFDNEQAAKEHEELLNLTAAFEVTSDVYWRDASPEEVVRWLVANYNITPKFLVA